MEISLDILIIVKVILQYLPNNRNDIREWFLNTNTKSIIGKVRCKNRMEENTEQFQKPSRAPLEMNKKPFMIQ